MIIRFAQSTSALMTTSLSLVMLLLFVVSGCAMLSEQPETPAAADPENQISSAETKNVPSNSGVKRSNAGDSDRKQPSSVTLDAEEIRKVQTLLKTVGFDPGPVNGAFGPKTKIALSRLRSSCAGLNDLLHGVDLEKIAPAIESSAANRNKAARTMPGKQDIRVIQVRLKDAGFDPGTVDGISGPNTRGAVARFRLGCGAVKTMLPAVLEAATSAEGGDISGASMARDDIMSVAIPDGGAGSAESGSFTSAATKDSSAGGGRRLR
ncbi:MAG: peptidoglycan-binding domain-containing protein [Deltaproteobacteria bacterium]|nr:peptidoglycan-binding domain-containing protein [Deltaproteobacteria bacterium]MDZ4345133.1 peptidoglycan-binding domain-containing protein [Candidatus Binatia bacterium]